MSPHLHYEIARARQQEMVDRAINSRRSHFRRTAINRHRTIKYRLVHAVAVLGVCASAGTAVTVSDAHSTQRSMRQHAAHVSAAQVAREIRGFEAKGYVPASCTVSGTLMRNYSTGQSVTVKS
jgi:hypothetical protein